MRLILIVAIMFLISSCTTETVKVKMIKKGNYKNLTCKTVKLGNIKGDTVGLRSFIYKKLLSNGLLIKRIGKTCIVSGKVENGINIINYKKKVKINYQDIPRCEYFAATCVAKNGIVFCSKENKITSKLYYYISNSLRNPQGYYLYKNKIYQIQEKCKPLYTYITCQRATITTTATLSVDVFKKIYTQSDLADACSSIGSIPYSSKPSVYKVSQNEIKYLQKMQAMKIADAFIKDFFPHPFTFKVEILKPKTEKDDVKKFLDALQSGNFSETELEKMLKYNTDYRLMYDVAVGYELLGNFDKAEAIFEYILKNTNDIELKSKIFDQLYYLSQRD
ncbi:hypothetical protein [Hippea alviniae]|uniref:hypothetical protein n=1 Tax=Hippea alviniae TaxID=1279027 RepID=UPI0003B6DEBF|nr:hypothetical protein [Hippea alviniae]